MQYIQSSETAAQQSSQRTAFQACPVQKLRSEVWGWSRADVAKQLGVDELTGVVITKVKSRSPSELAGLEVGMVVKKVGNKVVASVNDFQTAMKEFAVNQSVLLLVQVGEATRFVVVKGQSSWDLEYRKTRSRRDSKGLGRLTT